MATFSGETGEKVSYNVLSECLTGGTEEDYDKSKGQMAPAELQSDCLPNANRCTI
jgi:hypothetical protein